MTKYHFRMIEREYLTPVRPRPIHPCLSQYRMYMLWVRVLDLILPGNIKAPTRLISLSNVICNKEKNQTYDTNPYSYKNIYFSEYIYI